jgi:hypothetical protein
MRLSKSCCLSLKRARVCKTEKGMHNFRWAGAGTAVFLAAGIGMTHQQHECISRGQPAQLHGSLNADLLGSAATTSFS